VDCGFLALRHTPFSTGPHITEVEQERRGDGSLFHIVAEKGKYGAEPICLRRQVSFRKLLEPRGVKIRLGALVEGNEERERIQEERRVALTVLNEERVCAKWSEYVPGTDPGLMLEMAMFEALEERLEDNRRAWERTMEADRRKWEERRDADATKVENDRRKRDSRFNWFIAFLTLVGVLAMTPDALIARFGQWVWSKAWGLDPTSTNAPATDASPSASSPQPAPISQPQPQSLPQSSTFWE